MTYDNPVSFSWRAIMDNLMTHDKTTFRDLMSEYCDSPGSIFLVHDSLLACTILF